MAYDPTDPLQRRMAMLQMGDDSADDDNNPQAQADSISRAITNSQQMTNTETPPIQAPKPWQPNLQDMMPLAGETKLDHLSRIAQLGPQKSGIQNLAGVAQLAQAGAGLLGGGAGAAAGGSAGADIGAALLALA